MHSICIKFFNGADFLHSFLCQCKKFALSSEPMHKICIYVIGMKINDLEVNVNLNKIELNNVDDIKYERKGSYSNENIEICVTNIDDFVSSKIREYDAVCGCVAWLTNRKIIDALSEKESCQIIVQKEDFLRPDYYVKTKPNYFEIYSKIKGMDNKWGFGIKYNYCCSEVIDGVRCVGNCFSDAKTHEKMHHKFIVLYEKYWKEIFDDEGNVDNYYKSFKPVAVITGSFNYTENGMNSFENVMYIKDEDIAKFYHGEYVHVLGLSEKLDWTSRYVEPEYRIGS